MIRKFIVRLVLRSAAFKMLCVGLVATAVIATLILYFFNPDLFAWVLKALGVIVAVFGAGGLWQLIRRNRFHYWKVRVLTWVLFLAYIAMVAILLLGWAANWVAATVSTLMILIGVWHYVIVRRVHQDADPEIRRVKKQVDNFEEINSAFFNAKLHAADVGRLASKRIGATASQVENAKNTSGPGTITRNGQRYLVPRVVEIEDCPTGPRAIVTIYRGSTVDDYRKAAETLATELRVPGISITQRPQDRARGQLRMDFLLVDPLEAIVPYNDDPSEPVAPDTPWSIGIDESGGDVQMNLAESAHIMIAGATRSGKSVLTYSLLAHVIRMGTSARLLVADPNDTTIAPFEHLVSWSTNSQHPAEPIAMLRWVREEMVRRQSILRSMERDKFSSFSPELPLLVVVIDEAANYMRSSDGKAAAEFNAELMQVVAQGAKSGVRLVLITQRPDSTILPTSVRAQLSARFSFRLEDRETAKMIFPDLEDQDQLLRFDVGVGIMREVASEPRRFRGVYIPDHWAIAKQIPQGMPLIDVHSEDVSTPVPPSKLPATPASRTSDVEVGTPATSAHTSMDELLSNPPAYLQKSHDA
ncbi:hypothetical protein BWO91_17635 [Plantibacter flavus]|uniref:FtsK/SpoIIIE domain-containing protein n=1 Tax=Plantibacter flavus TaxID=150123 RepID=UPI00099B3A40|nr:FtsK/SpoIIIE domain-containing protein [Plantibacter flavus]AQX81542.1 hypothetical protein BWO91_17635 [Plantibacter flavus]